MKKILIMVSYIDTSEMTTTRAYAEHKAEVMRMEAKALKYPSCFKVISYVRHSNINKIEIIGCYDCNYTCDETTCTSKCTMIKCDNCDCQ